MKTIYEERSQAYHKLLIEEKEKEEMKREIENLKNYFHQEIDTIKKENLKHEEREEQLRKEVSALKAQIENIEQSNSDEKKINRAIFESLFYGAQSCILLQLEPEIRKKLFNELSHEFQLSLMNEFEEDTKFLFFKQLEHEKQVLFLNELSYSSKISIFNQIEKDNQLSIFCQIEETTQISIMNQLNDDSKMKLFNNIGKEKQISIISKLNNDSQQTIFKKMDHESQLILFKSLDQETKVQIMNVLDSKTKIAIFKQLQANEQNYILNSMKQCSQASLISQFDQETQLSLLNQKDDDERRSIFNDLEGEIQISILDKLNLIKAEEKEKISELLTYLSKKYQEIQENQEKDQKPSYIFIPSFKNQKKINEKGKSKKMPSVMIHWNMVELLYRSGKMKYKDLKKNLSAFNEIYFVIKYPSSEYEDIYERIIKMKNKGDLLINIAIFYTSTYASDNKFKYNPISYVILDSNVQQIELEEAQYEYIYSGILQSCNALIGVEITRSVSLISLRAFKSCSS